MQSACWNVTCLLLPLQERLRDKVHLQTVRILEREDALTPRMEDAGEEAPRHTPRPPARGLSCLSNTVVRRVSSGFVICPWRQYGPASLLPNCFPVFTIPHLLQQPSGEAVGVQGCCVLKMSVDSKADLMRTCGVT